MNKWKRREPFTPGLIDVDFLAETIEGYTVVGFNAGMAGDKRYAIEVEEGLVDRERGVMVVIVLQEDDAGNCLVKLPNESFFYNDQAVLPKSRIYAWSPRGCAKSAV